MFVDVIMSLETPSFLVCAQTDHEGQLRRRLWTDAMTCTAQIGTKWRPHEFENVSSSAKKFFPTSHSQDNAAFTAQGGKTLLCQL